MSPSKPLTPEKRAKRKYKREMNALLADIASSGLVRSPDGRLGYFIPTAHDPSMKPGVARFVRS